MIGASASSVGTVISRVLLFRDVQEISTGARSIGRPTGSSQRTRPGAEKWRSSSPSAPVTLIQPLACQASIRPRRPSPACRQRQAHRRHQSAVAPAASHPDRRAVPRRGARGALRARTRITPPSGPPIHPGWRRCSSVEYPGYSPSSRLAGQSPRPPNLQHLFPDKPLVKREIKTASSVPVFFSFLPVAGCLCP